MKCITPLPLLLVALCLQVQADPPPVPACDRIVITPAPGSSIVGAKVEGSNTSRAEGFVTIAELKDQPPSGQPADLKFDNHTLYRWLRYVAPPGPPAKVKRLELYAGERLLASTDKDAKAAKTVDTFADNQVDTHTITFDCNGTACPPSPNIKPGEGEVKGPADVMIEAPKNATVRYTTDGTWPTPTHGEVYAKPIHLDKSTTITAVTIMPNRPPSLPRTAIYLLPGSSQPGLTSAHIGNSLTGTTGQFWRYARTAGYDHHAMPFLRPGALTRELWPLASGEWPNDKVVNAKETAIRARGNVVLWDDFWAKVQSFDKVDLLTLQPRDFDLDKEATAELNFINLFRKKSTDVQPWLYCEWVELARQRPSDRGEVPSSQMTKTFPALTWEESMSAMLLYVEELQHIVNERDKGPGKRPHVIPSALAMGWMRHLIDAGQFPGTKPGDFYPLLFNDQVHPADGPIHGTANGGYLVDATWFAAFYHRPPAGHLVPFDTTYGPEQLAAVNRLAWDVIENYPDCGLYKEGTDPCGQPTIANDGKRITLTSSTPRAWFRYTLDGTTPTRTRGYVYCGVISVQPGIRVKAVAYKSGMADSEVADGGAVDASHP